MSNTTQTAGDKTPAENPVIWSSGEIIGDRAAIELIGPERGRRPNLLLWKDGEIVAVGAQVQHNGICYRPIELDPSIWKATRLPSGLADYGTTKELFTDTIDVFREYAGLARGDAVVATTWNATTWLPERMSNPPMLLISGLNMSGGVRVLRLLNCTSRHPLFLTGITRPAMCSLVDRFRPTLLINQPHLPRNMRHFCLTSNYRDVYVPANGRVLSSVSCCKAVFSGMQAGEDWWNSAAMRLTIAPSGREYPLLDDAAQSQIAEYLLPRWGMLRMRHLVNPQPPDFVKTDLAMPVGDVVRELQACIPEAEEICQELIPVIWANQEDARARSFLDPSTAIVEVLWPLFHSSEKPKTVGQLTDFLNTVLLARGGTRQYDAAEIGTLLSNLSVGRRRKNDGVYLVMDPGSNRQVHRLAVAYGVGEAVPGCAYCQDAEIKEKPGAALGENNAGQGNEGKVSEGGEGGEGGEGDCNT